MMIRELKHDADFLEMKRAQGRTYSRHPRSVIMANAALERARALKAGKSTSTEPTAKKKTSSNGSEKKTREAKSSIPWQKIADAYNSGLNTKEIAEKFDLVRPKTKDGSKNPYPYYLVVGYLTKLSHGVDIDGKHIEITRGAGGTRKEKK